MNISIKTFGILSILALAMTFNSCSKDEAPAAPGTENGDNNGNGDVTGEAFTIKAQMGDVVMSRATVKPEDGKSFTWETGDEFALYQSNDLTKANTFSIVNDKISPDGKSADFTCTDFTLASDTKYCAFYPQEFIKPDGGSNSFSYTIPESVYTQSENNKTDHLKEGMIMVASGKSSELAEGMSFAHKTALFRFGITNLKNESLTVKSIKLYSTDLECFAKGYSYNIDGTESISQKSKELSLSFGDGITLDTDNSIKAYTLAIPAAVLSESETETFTLEVVYDGGVAVNKIVLVNNDTKDESFYAGYCYTFNIDIKDYSRFYVIGTFSDWLWDECQYIYKIGESAYSGVIYMKDTGSENEYRWKVTENINDWSKCWPVDGNGKVTKRSCFFTLYTMDNDIFDRNIQQCDSWEVAGAFNNWGDDEAAKEIMEYGFDGEHYLISEDVEISENNFNWKLRGDVWSAQINSGSGITVQGDAASVDDTAMNLKVTAGAGTYEFKWYFNLPEPKIIVTKKQ